MAPTGAVTDNIDDSTIYTALSMFVLNEKDCQKQRKKNQQSEPFSLYQKSVKSKINHDH